MSRAAVLKVLDDLRHRVSKCHECPLSLTRRKTVFAAGNPEAELVILLDGPNDEEDRRGEPLHGDAGRLLTRILETFGFDRSNTYITHAVKCRPVGESGSSSYSRPRNRPITPTELKACSHYLQEQVIALRRKKLIVAMGSTAAHALLEYDQGTLVMRGMRRKFFSNWAGAFAVTYHPSYLLRNPEEKAKVYQDFLMFAKFLRGEIDPELLDRRHAKEKDDPELSEITDSRPWGKPHAFQQDVYSTKLSVER